MNEHETEYTGPAGVNFTDEELLVIWQFLTRIPTSENAEIRAKIKRYLEGQKGQELRL